MNVEPSSASPLPKTQQRPAEPACETKAFDAIPRAQWDAFVDGCGEAWIYHLSSFVIEAARINNGRDRSFAILQNDKIVAVCVLFVSRHGLAFVLTGPGPAFSDTRKNKDIVNLCYARMEELARENDCVAIRIWRSSLAPANFGLRYADTDVTNYGYGCGWWGEMHGFDIGYWVISDLSPSMDDILGVLHKEYSRYVRRCRDSNITSKIFDGAAGMEKGWDEFYTLHVETMTRTSGGVMSKERIDFFRRAVAGQRAILYNAYEKEVCVASVVVLLYKQGAYYEAGASSKVGLQLKAMVYLLYVAMCDLKERGIHYFNLGANIPSHRDTKWGTIGDFTGLFNALYLSAGLRRDFSLFRRESV